MSAAKSNHCAPARQVSTLALLLLGAVSMTAAMAPTGAASAAAAANATAAANTTNTTNTTNTADTASLTRRTQAIFQAVNDYWTQEFVVLKARYQPAALSLYEKSAPDSCGVSGTVVGPFYCPDDSRVYLPLGFLQQVQSRAGSSAELALAYVIGHEVGRHIQDLVGTTAEVEQARARSTPQLSARTWAVAELQSDCYAGLAARAAIAQQRILAGDAAVALQAVADVAQSEQAGLRDGQVMPDPLQTYLTPAERLKWFQEGLSTSNYSNCDTFSAEAAGRL